MTSNKAPNYKIITASRIYKNVNCDKYVDDDPFENYILNFDDIQRYEVAYPIGSGKYSTVFCGVMDKRRKCAIKVLKNVHITKIKKEVFFLSQIKDLPNAIHLYGVVEDKLTNTISIITDYVNTESPKTLFTRITINDIRVLMYRLLFTLNECHKLGIMHRDVKPGNMLFSKDCKRLKLIDWGLSDLYFPAKSYSVRVSTLRYKAPELLLNYQYYDYGIDVWGAGVVLAEMMIKFPFFEAADIDKMISQIAILFGSASVRKYSEKYGLTISFEALKDFPTDNSSKWSQTIRKIEPVKMDNNALDLLRKLLEIDHENRITSFEALQHPFFDPIRQNS